MKLHEEFKLYETMWESINTSAVVFIGDRSNKKIILDKVAKTNPANTMTVYSVKDFLREYDTANKELVKFYVDDTGKTELEQVCADMPANMKKKILNTAILVEWKTASNANVNTTSSSQTTATAQQPKLAWEALLAKADELLDELVSITDNVEEDDGDGYWQSEYDTWCYRYLYYTDTLENTAQLDKLCKDYSKKLPNVEFYWGEDDDVSEIGYIATRG